MASTPLPQEVVSAMEEGSNLEFAWPHVSAMDVQSRIHGALMRMADLDAHQISVAVADRKVVLTGTVHSSFERDEVRHAAWSSPGVGEIEDHLVVVP